MMYSLVFGLVIIVAAPAPKEAPKKDPPSILGEWIPESIIMAGQPDKIEAGMSFTLTKEGKCLVKEGAAEEPEAMEYTIDAKKEPAHIDLKEPEVNGAVTRGIYKIVGDTLIICLSMKGERPSKFASTADSATILVTLKRAKKN
jgi:uncharacterized protein (TIGR03067 family)